MPKEVKMRRYKGYIYLHNCPRCDSENRQMFVTGKAQSMEFLAKCEDCGLEIKDRSSEYIKYIWNSPKEEFLQRVLKQVRIEPYNAFVSKDRLTIIGNENLTRYLEEHTAWEFDLIKTNYFKGGYIVGRKGYV